MVTPGAQSLVTAILADSWGQTRAALARLWARRHAAESAESAESSEGPNADPDAGALAEAGAELDLAMGQSIAVAGDGPESERAERMRLFWTGYLAGQLAARPELADIIGGLPRLTGTGLDAPSTSVTVNTKTLSGTVKGNAVQADDVSGGIRFGR